MRDYFLTYRNDAGDNAKHKYIRRVTEQRSHESAYISQFGDVYGREEATIVYGDMATTWIFSGRQTGPCTIIRFIDGRLDITQCRINGQSVDLETWNRYREKCDTQLVKSAAKSD